MPSSFQHYSLLLVVTVCLSRNTEYPLYAIISNTPEYTNNDLLYIAGNFTAGQIEINSSAAKMLRSYNEEFQLVKYIPSWIAQPLNSAENIKSAITKLSVGSLTKALSGSVDDNKIYLKLNDKFIGKSIPLLPSNTTTNNSVSCKQFLSFIQIDQEYIKVNNIKKINNSYYELIVSRGLDNNEISSHSINSLILGPVYTETSPATCTNNMFRYAMNVESQYAIDYMVNLTKQAVDNGFSGGWFDCYSATQFSPYSMNGLKLSIDDLWDENNNSPYNCTSFRISEQNRLTSIWKQLENDNYKDTTIFANNMAYHQYYDDECGSKNLLIKNSINGFTKPLDGYCIEAYSMHEVGPMCSVNDTMFMLDVNTWKANVNMLINASQSQLNALPMIAQAGCKSPTLERLPNDKYNQLLIFGYSTFLMGVTARNGTVRFGIPAMRQPNGTGTRYVSVSDAFKWSLGDPMQFYKDIDSYAVNGNKHTSFMRQFENGLVVVNPVNTTDYGISLNGIYYNPQTKQQMPSNIDLSPYSAYVLLKNL